MSLFFSFCCRPPCARLENGGPVACPDLSSGTAPVQSHDVRDCQSGFSGARTSRLQLQRRRFLDAHPPGRVVRSCTFITLLTTKPWPQFRYRCGI